MDKDTGGFVHQLEILPPPINQGAMGCCSAVSVVQCSVAILQGKYGWRFDPWRYPSVQELINKVQNVFPQDCSYEVFGEGDFHGFSPETALKYIMCYGVSLEAYNSYCGRRTWTSTPPSFTRLRIQNYHRIAREVNIRPTIHQHPIVGVFNAYHSLRRYKEDTVYQGAEDADDEKTKTQHAVVIFGYDNEEGRDFYWIQNSWGEHWGCDGRGKISSNLFLYFVYPNLKGISIRGLRRKEAANVDLEKMNGSFASTMKHWCQKLKRWGKNMINGCKSQRTHASILPLKEPTDK